MDLGKLQEKINYKFNNLALLKQALTHRSYAKDHNERLEFLGDGVLDHIIALYLYNKYPNLSEGELSKMRSQLVNQEGLSTIARSLKLGEYLYLGEGEVKSGGRMRPSILADATEALFAAVSLDGGFSAVQKLIVHLFSSILANATNDNNDYKTELQEYLQSKHYSLPEYRVIDTLGPEHDMLFVVECRVADFNLLSKGGGKGKKQASQEAAYNMLIKLKS